MKPFAAVLLSLCIISSQCSVLHDDRIYRERAEKIMANFNEYFDSIVPQIQSFFIINGLDPFKSPDVLRGFSVTDLLGIEWHGEMELTNGWIQDLSTAHRNGDAVMIYENQILDVDIVLGFNDIVFNYDYVAQIMDIGPSGALAGSVVDLTIDIDIQINLVDMTLHIAKLEVLNAGEVTVHLEGSLLDFLYNAMIDLVIAIFHDTIIHAVVDGVKLELEEFLSTINLYDIINGLNP